MQKKNSKISWFKVIWLSKASKIPLSSLMFPILKARSRRNQMSKIYIYWPYNYINDCRKMMNLMVIGGNIFALCWLLLILVNCLSHFHAVRSVWAIFTIVLMMPKMHWQLWTKMHQRCKIGSKVQREVWTLRGSFCWDNQGWYISPNKENPLENRRTEN